MFDELSTDAVESELVTMAGQLAAGTCRMLGLMAEFDQRGGWAGPGLRSCAHWLNWRVGMSVRTARDHLRVAHALRQLPATTAAFAAGRVSYSKVRALTRIATPATEAGLLGIAVHGTTSQLEGLVAAARAGADPRPAAAQRGLRCSRAGDGSLLVRLRIPAERGEQLLATLDAYLAEQSPERSGDCPDGSAEPRPGAGGGPGVPDDLQTRADRQQTRSARREELHVRAEEHPPGPVVEPVAARRLDALLDLVAGHRADRPTTLVVHLRADHDHEPAADPADGDPVDDPAVDRADEPADEPVAAPAMDDRPVAWIEGGPPIPAAVAARITCTAAVQALLIDRRGNPLYLGRTRRTVSPRQLRALRVRDRNRCVFPGCTTTRNLEAHHIWWWRHGGPTDLDNLALTCGFHHTLIHEGGYQITPTPCGFSFARPDGTPIPAAGRPTAGDVDDLLARHTAAHLAIDDATITPRWGGERLDRDHALTWLLPELRAEAAAA